MARPGSCSTARRLARECRTGRIVHHLRAGGLRRLRGHLQGAEHPAHAIDVGIQRGARHHPGGHHGRPGRRARRCAAGPGHPGRAPRHVEPGGRVRGHRPHARDVQVQAERAVQPWHRPRRRGAPAGWRCEVSVLGALSFPLSTGRDLVYLVVAIGFILTLKGLSSPRGARRGTLVGAAAAAVGVAMTFTDPSLRTPVPGVNHALNLALMLSAMVVGAVIAVPAARLVKMTAMPQMVAIFNGVGGGAAALVSITEFLGFGGSGPATYKVLEVVFGALIGSVSLSGSAIAFAKLQEVMTGRPITDRGQQAINAVVGLGVLALALATLVTASSSLLWGMAGLSLVLGVIFVLPIGGADVPVLISLLNSFTGLAVAASGFTL